MLKTISEAVFSLVFPVSCELCGSLIPPRGVQGICHDCRGGIRLIAPPWCAGCGRSVLKDGERCGHCARESFYFDRALACVYYDDKMKKLLHAFKFERRRFLLPYFTGLLGDFRERYLAQTSWDLVVPVPMDGSYERARGFNQARLFSAAVAKNSGLVHAPQALGCRKAAVRQSSLRRSERKQNAAGRFFARNTGRITSARILLVDDILTTGQTASACAKALKNAGARTVSVLALARGL